VIVARTIAEARAALRELPRPLGFVPTMGALHAGHLSLVEAAGGRCASVAASVFVNPTQFGHGEDLSVYPRDEVRDLRLLEEAGVAVVFAPDADELYPEGFATLVHVGGALTESFEGASRPSHFDGVAVIVTKLLGVTQPDVLYLGEKDAQQLAVVRRFVRDLDLPVEVAGVPTLREPDGLAMSSRNVYLTPEQRAVAPDLHRALLAGAAAAEAPGANANDVVSAATDVLTPAFGLDYLAVVDADTFVQTAELGPRSVLVVAARLGSTRLIDNLSLAAPAVGEPLTTSSSSAYPAKDATA
jgi:pantoate--beta-alanine ligase